MTITIKTKLSEEDKKEQEQYILSVFDKVGDYFTYLSNYINGNGNLVLEFNTKGTTDKNLAKEVFDFVNKGITSERLINTNKNTINLIEILKCLS